MIINTNELKSYFRDNPNHDYTFVEHFIAAVEKLQIEMLQETNRDQK